MHIGKNIQTIRELLGIKQETLASILKLSQQTVSKIEQSQNLQDHSVERVAKAMGVNVELILNFNAQRIINFLHSTGTPTEPLDNDGVDYQILKKLIELFDRLLEMKVRNRN
jgi:transcriptional regulator with XRE-family HTH domain